MDRDEVWWVTHQERRALAGLLAGLTPEQWATPSLCTGWTVRDVAAHVISSPQSSATDVLPAFVRARGSFNRMVHDEARRLSDRPTDEIVADYRRLDGSRRHPVGTTYVDPLLDVLVHTQDIVVPLGLCHNMPADAAGRAAGRVLRLRPLFPLRRLSGRRLQATDTDWAWGRGRTVEGPMEVLLLLLTGRRVGLDRLSGAGVEGL